MNTTHLANLAATVHRDVLNRSHHRLDTTLRRNQLDGIIGAIREENPAAAQRVLDELSDTESMPGLRRTGCFEECTYCPTVNTDLAADLDMFFALGNEHMDDPTDPDTPDGGTPAAAPVPPVHVDLVEQHAA